MTAEEYLTNHAIPVEFAHDKMGWRWNEQSITIPVYNASGKKLYDKIRNLNYEVEVLTDKKTAKFFFDPAGSHPALYGIHRLKEGNKKVVLCEGEPDCVSLWAHGIPAVTSTGGVGKFDEGMAAQLTGREVYIFLDTDPAGRDQIVKTAQTFMSVGVTPKIGLLPEAVKDVSEFFAQGAKDTDFYKKMDESLSLNAYLIAQHALEHPITPADEFLKEDLPKSKWSINKFVRSSGITLWVGIGGVGKTTIVYSAIKAIANGERWLDQFDTNPGRILILDKENEDIDIQNSLRALEAGSPNIFLYRTTRDFQFLDDKAELTEEALYLRAYCEENKIDIIVLDSLVDFFLGDENQATYAALNLNAWLRTFPGKGVWPIHHENKEIPNQKRAASMRIRGSSHLFNGAQGVVSFSMIDETTPERIKVEHTKVRGARKVKPFEIDMVIKPDPENEGETIITGFKNMGEVQETKLKADQTKEAILDFLEKNLEVKYRGKEIAAALAPTYSERTVQTCLPELRAKGLVKWEMEKGKAYLYWHKLDVDNYVDNFENDEDE